MRMVVCRVSTQYTQLRLDPSTRMCPWDFRAGSIAPENPAYRFLDFAISETSVSPSAGCLRHETMD